MEENKLISAEYSNRFVLTTDQLVQAFGTSSNTLLKNFRRHKDEFIEEIHYFSLEGEKLKQFLSANSEAHLSGSPASEVHLSGIN